MYCLKKQAEGVKDQWTGVSGGPGAGPDPLISKRLSSLPRHYICFSVWGLRRDDYLKADIKKIKECVYADKEIYKNTFSTLFLSSF